MTVRWGRAAESGLYASESGLNVEAGMEQDEEVLSEGQFAVVADEAAIYGTAAELGDLGERLVRRFGDRATEDAREYVAREMSKHFVDAIEHGLGDMFAASTCEEAEWLVLLLALSGEPDGAAYVLVRHCEGEPGRDDGHGEIGAHREREMAFGVPMADGKAIRLAREYVDRVADSMIRPKVR